jgi:hypothetical protein
MNTHGRDGAHASRTLAKVVRSSVAYGAYQVRQVLASGGRDVARTVGRRLGHGEVSEACAERALLPRLREAAPGAVVLANGFSCRTQIHELDSGGCEAMHLAELLATTGGLDHDHPERTAPPPSPDGQGRCLARTAAALVGAAAACWTLIRARAAGGSSAGLSGKPCHCAGGGTGVAVILT